MTFLLVILLVVLVVTLCWLATRIRRAGRRDQSLASRNLGMLSGLVRHDRGKPFSRREPSRRSRYRGQVPRQTRGETQAVQRMPGRGITATLVDEPGPDAAVGYEPRLVPVKSATADQLLGLVVTVASSAPHFPQQDAYYVQRNVIALARSLQPAGIDQRAGALTLSAVMSSRLGRIMNVRDALMDSVESANRVVRSISSRDPEYSDMVTTLDIIVLASDAKRPSLHFAHIGNSSIWLLRVGDRAVRTLSEVQTMEDGPPLRAVGLSEEVVPQIDQVPVQPGDRVFVTSASSGFAFSPQVMEAVLAYAAGSLHDCAAAMADAVRSSGTPESVTILAAEVSKEALFSG